MRARPQKGPGERWFDCYYYETCLDRAALENWRAFNCEHCPIYSIFKVNTDQEIKLCEQCGKKATIHPNSALCASCMGKLAWKDGNSRKKPSKQPKKGKTTDDKGRHEISQQGRNTVLTVDFSKYPSILTELQKLAEEEVRSVDSQAIYILKNYFNGR